MASEEHRVVDITTIDELEKIAKNFPSNLIIIDFSATWCGPCKGIKPVYEALSKEYTDCIFLKVDIDESEELTDFFSPSSLPTFILMKDGKAFHKWSGTSVDIKSKLDEFINFDVSSLDEKKEDEKEV